MKIIKLEGKIKLISGLHIGGGDDTMKIGGIDNGVIKDVNSDKPYIPGSSLKGKMRSLLEWDCGVVNLTRNSDKEKGVPLNSSHIWKKNEKNEFQKDNFIDAKFANKDFFEKVENLLKVFGDKEGQFDITRINIGDCTLIEKKDQKVSEAKYENVIDRRNGTAQHPRQTERVPAGIEFRYDIRLKILDNDNENALKQLIARGLELVENDYLGGNGSRGYGRVEFSNKNEWKE